MKSYSLENSLRESIFREDLFLYNSSLARGVNLGLDLEDEISDLHGDVAVVSDHLAQALVPFLQVENLRHGEGSRLPLSAKGF